MLLKEFFDVAAYWVMCIADESVGQQVPMPFWSATNDDFVSRNGPASKSLGIF